MKTLVVLCLITLCYASYNLLVKVSSHHIVSVTTPPILATIALQAAALTVSIVYLLHLTREGASVMLPGKAYLWAIGAGICIGIAEVLYFTLFRGFEGERSINASTAIPFIVGGTIVVAVAVSHFVFREQLNTGQWAGIALAFAGMIVLALSSR